MGLVSEREREKVEEDETKSGLKKGFNKRSEKSIFMDPKEILRLCAAILIKGKEEKLWTILNAPLICMTKEMREFIGRLIGELVDIDVVVTEECFRKYMQLRVAIDVSKPLKRYLRLELSKGEESILLIQYEKFPEYCFQCGIIGHSYQDCQGRKDQTSLEVNKEFDFGPWMRATGPPCQSRAQGHHRNRGNGPSTRGGVLNNVSHSRVDHPWRKRNMGAKNVNIRSNSGQSVSMEDEQSSPYGAEKASGRNVGITLKETFLKANMEAGFGKGLHGVTPKVVPDWKLGL
ncbi:hypothetical protein EZV62_014700 [Acer yangbiense]|uniref:CCHC-type domain-containing protein n=1 Tax=Acer yangbiense TaxID=1000413 RepID=A0A5C7HSR8_9ROSI|nr:hypothetical protein EZV62_014700 [Acer yangbiense]